MTGPTRPGGGRPGERRPASAAKGTAAGGPGGLRSIDSNPDAKRRGMESLADLLPGTAREFGLEDQLEQARAAAAWLAIVAERVPAATGACRLTDLRQGVATIQADEPIVAQEIRLRSPELLAALRKSVRTPLRQLRITTRHV
jgi:predicted nucleic acid-binding Zn ribbon protein